MQQVNVRLPKDLVKQMNETGLRKGVLIKDAIEIYLDNELWVVGSSKSIANAIKEIDRRLSILENDSKILENRHTGLEKAIKKLQSVSIATTENVARPVAPMVAGKKDYEVVVNQILDDLGEVSRSALEGVDLTHYGTSGNAKNFLDKLRPALKAMEVRGELVSSTGEHGAITWQRVT